MLKFAKYRNIYIQQLLVTKQRFRLDILDYMVTSNHVHLLITAKNGTEISKALQFLHGSVGQKYNIIKKREGAFWSDRFHSTRIQSGNHLSRCLFYVDLNMVRAGAVQHPMEWLHSGIHELLGERRRYCIINMKRLLQCLAFDSIEQFRKWYQATIDEKLTCISHDRESYWSEAIAVGEPDWLHTSAIEAGCKRFTLRIRENEDKKSYTYFLAGKISLRDVFRV